jgi:hypothetical protein
MRSLCTISLIVLMGLASYGNAQGQNPPGTWCKPLSPVANNPLGNPAGDQAVVGCSSSSPSGQCLVDPSAVITAINNARRNEGLPPLVLPANPPNDYQYLTQDEKLVVLINLERQARGLSTFPIPDQFPPASYGHPALTWEAHNHAALLAEFYELNQGNNPVDGQPLVHSNSIDGTLGSRINAIPGFTQGTEAAPITTSPQGEVEGDTQNAENQVYTWLYRDSTSTPPWGHRDGLLGLTPSGVTPPSSNDNCYSQIGAGFAASANQAVYAQTYDVNPPSTVAPPDYFYIVDLVGQENAGWQLPPYNGFNTLTPSPLAATVVYNPPSPSSPPPGAPPPTTAMLSVYLGYQPYPFGAAYANDISTVYVYPDPEWVVGCPSPRVGQFCPSPLNQGALGSTGILCDKPGVSGTLGTGWGVYLCSVPVTFTKGVVVIVRDAYDQFVCLQPPFAQADPLIDVLAIPNSSGVPTSTMVTVATDSCGVAPLQPFSLP